MNKDVIGIVIILLFIGIITWIIWGSWDIFIGKKSVLENSNKPNNEIVVSPENNLELKQIPQNATTSIQEQPKNTQVQGKSAQQNTTSTQKPRLGVKKYILQNDEPSKKLDLIFIPANITNFSSLQSKIEEILYKNGKDVNDRPIASLFNTEPFINYKNKFNVAYIDKNIDETFFNCWQGQSNMTNQALFRCDEEKLQEAYKIFDPDYIIVIFNHTLRGFGGSSGGTIQYLDINLTLGQLGWTFMHEFGHQFGSLADEYSYQKSPAFPCGDTNNLSCFENYYRDTIKIIPNLDTLGCPEWCTSYDLSLDTVLTLDNNTCSQGKTEQECKSITEQTFGSPTCIWFNLPHPFFKINCVSHVGTKNIGINCKPNTECIFGGDGQLTFKPSSNSIMNNAGSITFNQPSKEHLENILKCCYPRQENELCTNFRNQFKNASQYEKIFNCQ